jgi:hypothetical protein
MFPGRANGIASAVERPRSSISSNAAVFCPCRRNSLTELTSAIGWRSTSSRTSVERLVEVAAQRDDARAVHERLGELARGDLALGDDDRAGQPPRAA